MTTPLTAEQKQRLKDKAKKVTDQVKDKKKSVDSITCRTSYGEVEIASIVERTDAEGISYVEVYLRGQTESGDPHFRIYNPPLLAEDPAGDIEVSGRKYREDPVQAIAEVVGRNGGRKVRRR